MCDLCRFNHAFILEIPEKMILCDLRWQITCNYNRIDGGHCDGTGHRKMAVLGMTGNHDDNLWKFRNDVIVWGTKIFLRPVKPIWNEEDWLP